MRERNRFPLALALFTALAVLAGVAAVADDLDVEPVAVCQPVGHVASLTGRASAAAPGADPRALACGDPVCAGDRISTAADSSAGLLIGDVLAQLDASSRARVGHTPDAVADVSLEQGGVRVVDPRDAGAPARLTAAGAQARIVGNDAEAHVLAEKAGTYALLCEWDAPLEVTRGRERAVAAPGGCLVAKPSEPLYRAGGHEERIAALGGTCDSGPPLALHLTPLPLVAAGPPGGPPLPRVSPLPPRSPCDNPGVVCGGVTVVEQDPTTGPFPGGTGTFPGGTGAPPDGDPLP